MLLDIYVISFTIAIVSSDHRLILTGTVNLRTDGYGGDLYKRCRFTLETVDMLREAIGSGRLGVRLSPYGFFNETSGEQRMEQWTYLCSELAKRNVAYM